MNHASFFLKMSGIRKDTYHFKGLNRLETCEIVPGSQVRLYSLYMYLFCKIKVVCKPSYRFITVVVEICRARAVMRRHGAAIDR